MFLLEGHRLTKRDRKWIYGTARYVSNQGEQALMQHPLFCCEALSNLINLFLMCKLRA